MQFYKGKYTFGKLVEKLPVPSITFHVDYSLDNNDDYLGNLSPFIIDVEEDVMTAIIKAEYKLKMESYLSNENRLLDDIEDYFDWLKTLKPGEFILTLLRRESYSGVTEKYYLRVVEKTSETGIKLRNLSKIFGYEDGETVHGKDDINAPTAVYKIVAINKHIDSIIRDYCKDKELFDIDKLNKIISKEFL